MRPEAQRLLDELDTGSKHLIGDRVVSCLACQDGGAVVEVGVDAGRQVPPVGVEQRIQTRIVPCPNCEAGRRRAASEHAIEACNCEHVWEPTLTDNNLYGCRKCGIRAQLGLQRLDVAR